MKYIHCHKCGKKTLTLINDEFICKSCGFKHHNRIIGTQAGNGICPKCCKKGLYHGSRVGDKYFYTFCSKCDYKFKKLKG